MAYDKFVNSRSNAAPSIVSKVRRTRFYIGGTHRFTCNTGDFVPFFCKEVLPGDTFDVRSSTLTRLETSLHQTMDNAYLELAFFYVPNRIVMNDWDKLLGANDDAWARSVEVKTPQIILRGASGAPTTRYGVAPQSLLNYLMLPAVSFPSYNEYAALSSAQQAHLNVTALPLRSTLQIYNDWFRDENLDSIVYFSKGNSDVGLLIDFTFNGGSFLPCNTTLKVNRFRDRFSSALPAPQKGSAVSFSLGGTAPIIAGTDTTSLGNIMMLRAEDSATDQYSNMVAIDPNTQYAYAPKGVTAGGTAVSTGTYAAGTGITSTNLMADLSEATAFTVNDLRLAIAAQVLAEQEARGGTRLTEVLFSQWNIKAPSLMMDRSEYLGGRRIPIQMLEVLQTSESSANSVLGEDAGHSKTFEGDNGGFLKSFMFHGYVIGVAFIRTARSYSQGIDRQFFRTDKYSYYNPIFDNIGEVPVYGNELMADMSFMDSASEYGNVFGYQEAWYEYKEGLNRDSGYMQAGITGTLDSWHYGDDYDDMPLLANDWLKEDADRVDRTIAVSSSAAFQWSCFIDVEAYATRQMHKYSVPNAFGFGSK